MAGDTVPSNLRSVLASLYGDAQHVHWIPRATSLDLRDVAHGSQQ